MVTYTNKTTEPATQSAATNLAGTNNKSSIHLQDNRQQATVQRKLNEATISTETTVQKKANDTGLPDNLKSGIENLSGYSMNDVKVYYNSSSPAQLNAHAYAQGTNIHVAAGQEKHLPHEAWHVVQQKQGRVRPTLQMKRKVNINDDAGLEKEADVMGTKAYQFKDEKNGANNTTQKGNTVTHREANQLSTSVQRVLIAANETHLSPEMIEGIIRDGFIKHGEIEGRAIAVAIEQEQHGATTHTLEQLAQQLMQSADKASKRTGHLISLLVHTHLKQNTPEARESWEHIGHLTELITESAPELNRRIPPPRLVNIVTEERIPPPDLWYAATVAAIRMGALIEPGFEFLRHILRSQAHFILEISPDIKHEFLLQQVPLGTKKVGLVSIPEYGGESAGSLNERIGIRDHSGKYEELLGIIFKTLDLGHKLVDAWESVAHRNAGTVSSKSSFTYLALLSPNSLQEVIGANGSVLSDGYYMFTIDSSFRFRYMPAANFVGEGGENKSFVQYVPHAQLMAQQKVAGAGNFKISKGKFIWIDNGSGHYRVDAGVNTTNTSRTLHALGYDLHGVRFLNRATGDLKHEYQQGNSILETMQSGRPDVTHEVRQMEETMNRLEQLKTRGEVRIHLPEVEESLEMMHILPPQIRRTPILEMDSLFGQSKKLIDSIGNDQL